MRKSKKRVVEVRDDDVTVIPVEIDNHFIEFYKKETGRSRVSQKRLSQFVQHLVDSHRSED